jgi:polyhydroxyalkanoate synthesis repressor PhaR
MASQPSTDDVIIIKKYANRRLYDTESSTYITLDRLAQLVREKRDFKVVDAKTGEDITHNVLTQIIMDEEARGANMLPVNFLRQLIGLYGDQVQSFVPQYLEASLEALQRNQSQFREAVSGAMTGAFNAAASGLAPAAAKAAPEGDSVSKAELAELRAQMAELQKKLDRLGG